MIGFSGGSGGGVADLLEKLLTLLSDPKATRKAIADIRTAERAAEHRITEADKREADIKTANDQRTADLDGRANVCNDREAKLERQENHLNLRVAALNARDHTITDVERVLTGRQAHLTAHEIKATQRGAALDTQEADLKLRENAAAVLDTSATDMKRDYEARIARLKRSLAET